MDFTLSEKMGYLCNCKSEISINVCNAVEGHGLQAMKIVHHQPSGCFDLLMSGQQSVNPSREAIYVLSRKYKRFAFAHPFTTEMNLKSCVSLAKDTILTAFLWGIPPISHNALDRIICPAFCQWFNVVLWNGHINNCSNCT